MLSSTHLTSVEVEPPKQGPPRIQNKFLKGDVSTSPGVSDGFKRKFKVDPSQPGLKELQAYVEALEREVAASHGVLDMIDRIDSMLEEAISSNWSTATLMENLLPAGFKEMPGAKMLMVRTLDESLTYVDYHHPPVPFDEFGLTKDELNELVELIKDESGCEEVINGNLYLGSRLDVNDMFLGAVIVLCDSCQIRSHEDPNRIGSENGPIPVITNPNESLMRTLVRWGEVVDNFIGDAVKARKKDLALRRLFEALRHPILDEALDAAIKVLKEYVPFDDLVMVIYYEGVASIALKSGEEHEKGAQPISSTDTDSVDNNPGEKNYLTEARPYLKAVRTMSDSMSMSSDKIRRMTPRLKNLLNFRIVRHDDQSTPLKPSASVDSLDEMAMDCYAGNTQPLVERCRLNQMAREEFSIYKEDGSTSCGRITVGMGQPMTPFCRDIMLRLSDSISQRLSAFNKEWKQLSRNFSEQDVRKLLQDQDYFTRYLTPREQTVAIMYCDITGFTWLSETVLKKPSRIGHLIDQWSNKAVEFIWESGGVFDKMVGDCIIGLWGPPFFQWGPKETCHRALQAACAIRQFSKHLLHQLAELADHDVGDRELGVAIGLNYCPLMVGTYGPDKNYTGFSSGMNNTARLQGLAKCNEILCMDTFANTYDTPLEFSKPRSEKVKNVAQPIPFRAYQRSEPRIMRVQKAGPLAPVLSWTEDNTPNGMTRFINRLNRLRVSESMGSQ